MRILMLVLKFGASHCSTVPLCSTPSSSDLSESTPIGIPSLSAVEGLTAAGGIGPDELDAVGLDEEKRAGGSTPAGGAFGLGGIGVSLLSLSARNRSVWIACAL